MCLSSENLQNFENVNLHDSILLYIYQIIYMFVKIQESMIETRVQPIQVYSLLHEWLLIII